MQNPVKLRVKPVEVDGMQYTGDNVEALMQWIREQDPSFTTCSVVRDYPLTPVSMVDLRTMRPAEFLVISGEVKEFRMFRDQWLLRSAAGALSVHNSAEISAKYERVA